MALLGAGVALGALVWPWLTPSPAELYIGLTVVCLLCGISPSQRCAALSWTSGAVILGALSTTLQPGPIDPQSAQRVRGTVLHRSGPWVRVQTPDGQVRVHLGDDAPKPGVQVAMWTRESTARAVLPGQRRPGPNNQRRRLTERRVQDWLQLGHPEPPDNPQWSAAVHGGVLRALATGDKSEVPASTKRLFERTGTLHLMAVSGLHVGLVSVGVAAVASVLTRPLVLLGWVRTPQWLAAIAAAIAAVAYGADVGWPASAQRAGWMVILTMMARCLGRPIDPWTLLGMAATGVILLDPGQIGDIGFQLSFGAVIGILLWAPRVMALLPPKVWPPVRWLAGSMGVTTGAVIGTLPVLAWDFQSLAILSIPANLIATPLIGAIGVPAALLAAHGPTWLTTTAVTVGDTAIGLALALLKPLSLSPLAPAVGPMAAAGLACAALMARWPVKALLVMGVCLWPRGTPSDLRVTFPAIGQGSAALIEWPSGRRWLFDGGPPSSQLLHWLRREGIRHIDRVIVSHAHPDHTGGLQPVLEQLRVDELWAASPPQTPRSHFHSLWRTAAQRGVRLHLARPDGRVVLHPPAAWSPDSAHHINERSLVVRITHGQHSFLFTGDIQSKAEARLSTTVPPSTVVQVPHHGSATSSSTDFVHATQAEWAVFSVGRDNRYRHPSPKVLARWGPSRSLRTDTDGTVRFISNGRELTVQRWQPQLGWQKLDRQRLRPPSSAH